MFFHTHLFYAKHIEPSLDSLTIIGSMLPDFAMTSVIDWDALHKKDGVQKFGTYIQATNPQYTSLITGIQYHNIVDRLSHADYHQATGYAYQNATPELVKLLTQAFSIDEKVARVTAHNFIESAVEMYTLRDYPDLVLLLKNATLHVDIDKLATLLATFYEKDIDDVKVKLQMYFSLATKYDLQDIDDWILLWEEMGILLYAQKAEKQRVKEALQLSFQITKDTYKEFLITALAVTDTSIKDGN